VDAVELEIQGAFVLTPVIHSDSRGNFLEWFRADVFEKTLGYPFRLAQANTSVSAAGTIRGIHFAQFPRSQAKYVTCTRGEVFDVVVDVRVGSPTYGQWEAVSLDDRARKAVYLSEGLGHAFMALEDDSVVTYLCSAPFAPDREHGINPMDETVAIDWPGIDLQGRRLEPLLSSKDAQAPGLEYARQTGLLPTMQEVRAWVATLREATVGQ
jgi:dTDP-4-dehydrorhamnose 3,5-epimerase